MNVIRRLVPYTLIPLAVLACGLANAPWLRAFPAAVLAVPLFGAAVLSVLVPLIVIGIGVRSVWLTALVSVVIFVLYELLVVLREPVGFGDLYRGLLHGPSQILTFALPLSSPRTLLVAPVALCWLTGAILGECVAREWQTFVPYAALLVAFGLSYAATVRAVSTPADGHRYDTLLAAGLLLTLLLLRAAQAWVAQDNSAQSTQPDGVLPLRSLTIGVLLSILVAFGAVGVAQTISTRGNPSTAARTPPLDRTKPFTPVSFIASLRPNDPNAKGQPVFSVMTDRASTNYISIANVDYYDGDGWSFDRTFRPSGGIVPSDTNATLRTASPAVTQTYTIARGPLAGAPWMPYMYRPQQITGASVDIDADTGMIVASTPLHAGDTYTVGSKVTTKQFEDLPKTATAIGGSQADNAPPTDNIMSTALQTLAASLAVQTKVPVGDKVAFLQAVAKDFRDNFALAGSSTQRNAPSSSATRPRSTPQRSPTSSASTPPPTAAAQRAGSTSFADVLASIQQQRSATPEQYATLMCLLARSIGVPARVATGFRIPLSNDSANLPAGDYPVTTADAYTWVEIPVNGVGWVVLDPSPSRHSDVNRQSSAAAQPTPSPSPTTGQAVITHAPSAGHAVGQKSAVDHGNQAPILMIAVLVVAAVAAVMLLLALFQIGRRRLRMRRRRRFGDPRRRLLGAWQESLDMLEESGMPDLTNLTSREISEQTGARFGGDTGAQARFLGDAANAAIFSPTSWIGPAEADTAWRAQGVLTRSVRDRLTWRERLTARLRYHKPGGRRRRVSYGFYAATARRRARHSTTAAR
ncbi:MAG TPA: transglutaminase-like domain-containing protein [Jatrophihabitans sp.]|nr:transglutaminase-like domain-containing protein [Jatrophihabitans sp.]